MQGAVGRRPRLDDKPATERIQLFARALPGDPGGHGSLGRDQPAAAALFDLGRGSLVRPAAGGAGSPSRGSGDGTIILVRLHGDPLGVVCIDRAAESLEPAALRALVWSLFGRHVRAHVERHGCLRQPRSADDMASWPGSPTNCPRQATDQAPGTIAVIVPTRDRAEKLRRCLESLVAMPGPRCDIVVVDNAPGQGRTEAAVDAVRAGSPHEIRYVAEERPGSSAARNRGLVETQADIVAFTDDDVVADRDWLARLVAPFADPAVGAVTGLTQPLELVTPAQWRFERYAGFSKGFERRVYDLGANRAERLLYPFWGGVFGSGNNAGFRRRSLVAVGGFDTALGPGGRCGRAKTSTR